MNSRIIMTAAGVSLALQCVDSALPEVIHWGADLRPVSQIDLESLALATAPLFAPSSPDVPVRYAVLPEARRGITVRPGLIASRDGLDWTPNWRVDSVLVDGLDAGSFHAGGAGQAQFHAVADGLELLITIELTPQGLVAARAEVTNRGAGTFAVNELTLAMPVPSRATEILDFAGRWGVERFAQRTQLTTGAHRREARHGRTGADSAYLLHLGTPGFGFASGEVWSVHTAWSGNHVHQAERDLLGAQLISGGELLLAGEIRLEPDQSYASPWLYFGYGVGLDAVADRFHGFLRSLPHAPSPQRPVTMNVWEAVYFNHDPQRLIDLANRAAAVGVERFVLDDGWFGARRNELAGLGDWVVSDEVWPDGLHPLVDAVHNLGMEFGLWVEPEMVNLDSDVARAHPDWILQPAGRLPVESRHQQVLNLAHPDAYRHVRDQLLAVLDTYRIDYLKWDHNRDLVDAGGIGGRPGVHDQTLAFYRLLDELRHRNPDLEVESCSSGGARIDLEVLKRAERVWVSDVIDPAERQRMLPWTGQLIPPEFQGSHIASGRSHNTARWHDLSFRAATAVFGHLGIEWDLSQATDEEIAELTWWVDWYKSRRQVLLGGRQVRVDMPDPGTWFKGVVTDSWAIFSLSQLTATSTANLGLLTFPGLDEDATYRLTVIDRQLVPSDLRLTWEATPIDLPGRVLVHAGVRAPLMLPETAVLFELERL